MTWDDEQHRKAAAERRRAASADELDRIWDAVAAHGPVTALDIALMVLRRTGSRGADRAGHRLEKLTARGVLRWTRRIDHRTGHYARFYEATQRRNDMANKRQQPAHRASSSWTAAETEAMNEVVQALLGGCKDLQPLVARRRAELASIEKRVTGMKASMNRRAAAEAKTAAE